tara:strand:+ start:224 stop:487 length:264 start_codon:yes stop_codon:yes gene_type:complete
MTIKIEKYRFQPYPDSYEPTPSELHQEAFKTFFTADSCDWEEFFTPSDFNVNGHENRKEHLYALGLKLANLYRQNYEDESGQYWGDA